MKRILFLLFAVSVSFVSLAQTQQGVVKTLGRPGRPGHGISEAEIRIKGDVNHLLSNAKGEFSFDIRFIASSKTFIISSVRKKGYVIADNDLTKRKNPLSMGIPVVVVMVSQAELDADIRKIEEKTRQTVQANYEQRIKILDRQLKDAVISEENYRAELLQLMDWYDNIDNLVEKMADYYARVDYDILSEEDAEINHCIELGELDRADSLIDARGTISDRISAAKVQISHGKKMQESGLSIEQDGIAKLQSAQLDAEHKYNIAMAKFDNCSALEMLKQLVASDSTSFDYRMRLADFYRKNIIDYKESEKNYKYALEISKSTNDTIDIVSCLNNYGILLKDMGNYPDAYKTLCDALDLRQNYSNEFSKGLASIYNNLISYYILVYDYAEARNKCYELISLIESSEDKDSPDMQDALNVIRHHLAYCFAVEGEYKEAEELMKDNLNKFIEQYGNNNSNTFSGYNALGWLYDKTDRRTEALEMNEEALKIAKTLYGENHIDIATAYSNIGYTYSALGDYMKSLDFAEKALCVRRNLLGNLHPHVALSLHNIACIFIENEEYEKSLPYLFEAANIREKMLPAINPSTASTFQHLAIAYSHLPNPDYEKATEWAIRASEIYEEIKGKEENFIMTAIDASRYQYAMGNYEASISIAKKLCSKIHTYQEPNSSYIIAAFDLLRQNYYKIGDYPKAMDAAIQEFLHQMKYDSTNLQKTLGKYGNIVSIYEQALRDNVETVKIDSIMKEFLYCIKPTLTVVSEDSPAGKLGLSGTYDIVHYNDWDIVDNPVEFMRYKESQDEHSKKLILTRDGEFYAYSFDKKIGAMMLVSLFNPEERERIVKSYKKSKKKLMNSFE